MLVCPHANVQSTVMSEVCWQLNSCGNMTFAAQHLQLKRTFKHCQEQLGIAHEVPEDSCYARGLVLQLPLAFDSLSSALTVATHQCRSLKALL